MSKTGTVKFFNQIKGFGFIVQDDGGEDLFAHSNNIVDGNSLQEGDNVRYDAEWDDMKGKSLAQNITGGTGGPPGSGGKGKGGKGKGYGGGGGKGVGRAGPGGGAKTGTVKFFNQMKGFGFIVQDDGGEDLFAHANNISDGQSLNEGDTVQYDEEWDDRKGKSNAQNITGGSGGSGGGGFGGGKGFGGKGGKY